jgi:hypothetical protein
MAWKRTTKSEQGRRIVLRAIPREEEEKKTMGRMVWRAAWEDRGAGSTRSARRRGRSQR